MLVDYTYAEFLSRWREVKARSRLLEGPSLVDRLALAERNEPGIAARVLADLERMAPAGGSRVVHESELWLRPKQLAIIKSRSPVVFVVGGRGVGKTTIGSSWIARRLEKGARRLVMVGPSEGDIEEIMLGGELRRADGDFGGTGVLDVLPPWIKAVPRLDSKEVEFPQYRAMLTLHSAHLPKYRGPNVDSVWGDELLKWRYAPELISNLRLACRRVGRVRFQLLFTTSPWKMPALRDLVMDPDVETFHGRTDENLGNVDPLWSDGQFRRLAGTKQGEEELGGELGFEDDGAMFTLSTIDAHRVPVSEVPELQRIAVGVDPAVSVGEKSDATGIVAVGRAGDDQSGHGYVLEDRTGRYAWDEWGRQAVTLAIERGASCIVVEKNRAGDGAAANIRTAGDRLGWRTVRRRPDTQSLLDLEKDGRRIQIVEVLALGDKATRAGPLSAMYQQGRMHHVGPRSALERLENEMTEWDPNTGISPNGLDALTHGSTELFSLDRAPRVDGANALRGMAALNQRLQALAPVHGAKRLPVGGGYRRGF